MFLILGLWLLTMGSGCSAVQRFSARPAPAPFQIPTPGPAYVDTFEALWQAISENYVYADLEGINPEGIRAEYLPKIQSANSDEEFLELIDALVEELPDGSIVYETRSERIEAETGDTISYEGIGAFVSFRTEPDPHVVLLSIIPNSPAEKAGLHAHDSVLAIDGSPVRAEEGMDVVQRVRGPAGSETILTVRSPDQPVREIKVTRGQLSAAAPLQASTIPNTGLAYFLFPPAVYESLVNDFATGLETFSAQGLDGIILDLRIASNGANWPINALLTLFADGEIGEFYTRQETTPVAIEGQDILNSQSLPIAVLVGPDTSGTPEIFAAMLQAIGRATIVGMPTQGEIESFSEFQLVDGSRAFILTSSYRTPTGDEVGLTGVSPDIPVDADWDQVTFMHDPVLESAVQQLLEGQ